jgi:DNA-binding CsgD family transcriptional regulator
MTSALEHFEKHQELRARIFTEESNKQLNELRVLRDLEKAESRAEIERLKAERLEQQLDAKQRELAATAMHLARQTETLGRFRNDLRYIIRESSDSIVIVKSIKLKLEELPCESIDWGKFESEFQETYPEFTAKLVKKYPSLTKMEARICSLVKLQLTTPDIAQLLCVSDRTVENHRMHIRKKMELKKGVELHDVLTGI